MPRSSARRAGRTGGAAEFLGLAALAVSMLVLWSGLAKAQAVSISERVTGPIARMDLRELPWRGIGKLESAAASARTICTGALIGPRTVLSAAHCLTNVRTGRDFLPSSIHFLIGFEGGTNAASVTAIRLIKGAFDPSDPIGTRGGDWALVTLEAPIGAPDRLLELSDRLPSPGATVMVGGYGQEDPDVLAADTNCHVLGYESDSAHRLLIHHDCNAARGVSGAPLLVRTRKGWLVAGINVARSRVHADGLAVTHYGAQTRF